MILVYLSIQDYIKDSPCFSFFLFSLLDYPSTFLPWIALILTEEKGRLTISSVIFSATQEFHKNAAYQVLQGDMDFNEPSGQAGFITYFSKVGHLQTMDNVLRKSDKNNKKTDGQNEEKRKSWWIIMKTMKK